MLSASRFHPYSVGVESRLLCTVEKDFQGAQNILGFEQLQGLLDRLRKHCVEVD